MAGEGGPVDKKEAARWFKVAAEIGHVQACTNLGIAYMRGDGVPQSRMEAIRYLTRGASAGDELAVMQLMRIGVQASWKRLWLLVACKLVLVRGVEPV